MFLWQILVAGLQNYFPMKRNTGSQNHQGQTQIISGGLQMVENYCKHICTKIIFTTKT